LGQEVVKPLESKYSEMDRDALAQLRELEDKNRRLKRIVAQQMLALDELKDLLSKK